MTEPASRQYSDARWFQVVYLAALVLAVTGLALATTYGPNTRVIADETIYRMNTGALARLDLLAVEPHFPPLYSLAMVPFYFGFPNSEWMWSLSLNLLCAAVSILLAFRIGAKALSPSIGLLFATVVAVLPTHAIYLRTAFSENLYVPLLLILVQLVLEHGRSESTQVRTACLMGLTVGLLYLTRFFAVTALISGLLFLVVFSKRRFAATVAYSACCCIVLLPWFAIVGYQLAVHPDVGPRYAHLPWILKVIGQSLGLAAGGGGYSSLIPTNAGIFGVDLLLHFCYMTFLLLPIVPVLVEGVLLRSGRSFRLTPFELFVVLFVALSFILTLRHNSAKELGNAAFMFRYLVPLELPIIFATLMRQRTSGPSGDWSSVSWKALAVSTVIIAVSYIGLSSGFFVFQLQPRYLALQQAPHFFPLNTTVGMLVLTLIVGLSCFFYSYRGRHRVLVLGAWFVVFGVVWRFNLSANPSYLQLVGQ